MNTRIFNLRKSSLEAFPCISAERALLVTEYYSRLDTHQKPIPIQRAEAFRHVLLNKFICIQDDELIVGEQGEKIKAIPTYPEMFLHSLKDFDGLNSLSKKKCMVDAPTKKAYKEVIIPFWKGKSQYEYICNNMTTTWMQAYQSGIFTTFQEQQAEHATCGEKLFKMGMSDYIQHINQQIDIFKNKHNSVHQLNELEAMKIVAQAIVSYAQRHVTTLQLKLNLCNDPKRKEELREMIQICQNVPEHAPQTFQEALQHYWFIHLGIITELNPWNLFSPGRLDRHLLPFYHKGIADGSLTKERAKELLEAFWIKFNNHLSSLRGGVTALENNSDFVCINLGGVNENGTNAVNELSYLILDVIEEMQLPQPEAVFQISKKTPHHFIKRALKIVQTGFKQLSFLNTDEMVQALLRQGKSIEDARNGGTSGGIESKAFGTETPSLSGCFNLNKILELTLFNGFDPKTLQHIGLKTGELTSFQTFDQFYAAFEKQLRHFINLTIEGNNRIEQLFAERMPAPFLSLFIDDCVLKATDYRAGGGRYNTSYIQGVGFGCLCDSLSSLRQCVFEEKTVNPNELLNALNKNFAFFDSLRCRLIYDVPKWGNNNAYADEQAIRAFNSFYDAVDGRLNSRGGVFGISLPSAYSHVHFGSVLGATPDGRLAETPISNGINPMQGADIKGAMAVLQSAAKLDHIRTGGTLLQQKFTPEFFENDDALDTLCALIRTYFLLDGHHIQFNMVKSETLRLANQQSECYHEIIRIAGYSGYFNNLNKNPQNEMMKKTE